jgi:hypothetical protein
VLLEVVEIAGDRMVVGAEVSTVSDGEIELFRAQLQGMSISLTRAESGYGNVS